MRENKFFSKVLFFFFFANILFVLVGLISPGVKASSVCGGTARGCKTIITFSYCTTGGSCGSAACNGQCNRVWDPFEKQYIWGTCICSSSCVETFFKSCHSSGGSCVADGCGSGTCGSTPPNCYWSCVPDCAGKQCGDDTCGGSCGTCVGGQVCSGNSCVNPCGATAPTGLSVARVSPTSATLSWTPGSGGAEQRVYIGANKNEVQVNCNGTYTPACVVSVTGLPTSQSSYSTGNVLTAGTVYYYRVVNWLNGSCSGTSATNTTISSCSVNPSSLAITTGMSASLISSVNSSTDISGVNFTSGNTGVATVNPGSDATYAYQTTVTGVAPGSTNVTSDVIIGGVSNCSAVTPVTVSPPGPWWQVKDGDVTTNGDITDGVPIGNFFNLAGAGGYPGVPSYGGTTSLTSANVSATGWLANSSYNSTKVYDSNFFSNVIPADVAVTNGTLTMVTPSSIDGSIFTSGGTPAYGYYWYEYDPAANGEADLTITGSFDVGARKVILFSKGNVNIQGNINLTKGSGFFMMVAGNITIDPTVGGGVNPNLEGIYVADGLFSTGTGGAQSDSKLHVYGSVAAYGGISLQRNMGSPNSEPSELFEYAPELELLYPSKLGARPMSWREVAP